MKSSKNKICYLVFLVFLLSINTIASAKVEIILGNTPLGTNPNIAFKIPSTEASEIIISRDQYIISYNKFQRLPNWVAWKLEADQIGNSGRSNNFIQDPDLENYLKQTQSNGHAVDPNEYKGSCFDRGHQVPSADRTDDMQNNQMTFLMSNMTPQTPYLNRVIWEHLEQYTRDLVQKQGKKVYIIAGPIYDQNFGKIGPNNDIAVPSKNFKVIVVLEANQTPQDINNQTPIISVIMPNTLQDGSNPIADKTQLCKPLNPGPLDVNDWTKYITNLAQVERLSGLKIH